jgi:hypothetical protein
MSRRIDLGGGQLRIDRIDIKRPYRIQGKAEMLANFTPHPLAPGIGDPVFQSCNNSPGHIYSVEILMA